MVVQCLELLLGIGGTKNTNFPQFIFSLKEIVWLRLGVIFFPAATAFFITASSIFRDSWNSLSQNTEHFFPKTLFKWCCIPAIIYQYVCEDITPRLLLELPKWKNWMHKSNSFKVISFTSFKILNSPWTRVCQSHRHVETSSLSIYFSFLYFQEFSNPSLLQAF